MRRMASHRSWSLAWAYAWDGICSTEEESREDLSLSLFLCSTRISRRKITKFHPRGEVEQHSKELWISMVTTVDGSHDNHGNIVENRDVGYKRNATDALRINFSCNP